VAGGNRASLSLHGLDGAHLRVSGLAQVVLSDLLRDQLRGIAERYIHIRDSGMCSYTVCSRNLHRDQQFIARLLTP
jgi:hypothetical protein